MCDIRFAAEGAKFTSAFARRGLIAEHGVSYMLPRVVGPSNALDILMSGRVFMADEAKEMGVVSRVCLPTSSSLQPLSMRRSWLDTVRRGPWRR